MAIFFYIAIYRDRKIKTGFSGGHIVIILVIEKRNPILIFLSL